nr:hypothetical protein [Tanacetum cinerariifolium]
IDLPVFIHVVDPTKVRIVKRERADGEAKLWDYAVGRVIPILSKWTCLHLSMACDSTPIGCSARAKNELKASVAKLFDESGSTEHVDSATGGGHDAEIEFVTAVEDTAAGSVAAERPKHPRNKRPVATDASGSSHPPKKRGGIKAGVSAMPTLPFVTSSVFATPEREDGAPLDSVTRANLCFVGLAVRFAVLPPVTTEAMITTSVPYVSPVPVPRLDVAGLSHPPGKELSLGSWEVDSKNLHEVFVLQWNVSNDALLDDLDTSKEFIDHLAPLVLFTQICDMDYEELFTEFNVGSARQACLSAKVRMRTEYCLSERKRIFKEEPPSIYMWWTKCPPILASIIIGPFVSSFSPKGGKEITDSGEKVWVDALIRGSEAAISPPRNVVVTLIISSTDFGILSCQRLINSGLVIPCITPDIFILSGAHSHP